MMSPFSGLYILALSTLGVSYQFASNKYIVLLYLQNRLNTYNNSAEGGIASTLGAYTLLTILFNWL